jgi:hypothetical protein
MVHIILVVGKCNLSSLMQDGLEVNVEKTKYMVVSGDQNAGQNHDIMVDNKSFERLEQLKYLGTTLKSQRSIHKEIKSRLESGSSC